MHPKWGRRVCIVFFVVGPRVHTAARPVDYIIHKIQVPLCSVYYTHLKYVVYTGRSGFRIKKLTATIIRVHFQTSLTDTLITLYTKQYLRISYLCIWPPSVVFFFFLNFLRPAIVLHRPYILYYMCALYILP